MTQYFYSFSSAGFCCDDIHGPRKISIPDPAWVKPTLENGAPDEQAQQPTITIDNPDCRLPDDAIEITPELYQQLLDGRQAGKKIARGSNGLPALQAPASGLVAASVVAAIKEERDRRTQGGYKVGEEWFHSDQFSRSQQLGLVLLGASIPAGLKWKTMGGSFVTMTQALAGQILAAGAASDAAIFAHAEQLIAQVQAAPDPSTIDPLAGWPKIYGE